jgi:mono/diheme cytochrome c family protein
MTSRIGWIVLFTSAFCGCERGMHDMYEQPKYAPLTPSKLFDDGNSSRPQVFGTVPHSSGALAGSSSGRSDPIMPPAPAGPAVAVGAQGRSLASADAAAVSGYANPMPITLPFIARGRDRYDVYCAPCHSRTGDGDGMIVRRGFPAPPTYHTDRLRAAPDSHFFQVISDGFGVMYPYADRITPEDRWAIVAYIRALQLSRHASSAELGAADGAALRGQAK